MYFLRVVLVLYSLACTVMTRAEPAYEFPRQLSDTPTTDPTGLPSPTFNPPNPVFPSVLPTSSAILVFHQIPQLTVCSRASITWVYSGPNDAIKLVVTNSNVSQSTTVPPIPQPNNVSFPDISETITTSADPTGLNFSWPIVDVPQGYYIIRAFMADPSIPLKASSPPFFVMNGTDTSCLNAASPSPSPSSSSSPPPSPSSSQALAGASTGAKSKVKDAAIAGGIIGGLMLLAIIVAYLIYRRRSSSSTLTSLGKWGGLSSNDSRYGPSSGPPSKPRSYSRATPTEHNGRARMNSQVSGIPAATPRTTIGSDEDATVISPSEEKFVSPMTPSKWSVKTPTFGSGDLDAITPLPYARRCSSTSSNHNHARSSWEANNVTGSFDSAQLARRRSADYRLPPLTLTHSLGASDNFTQGAEMVPMGRSVSSGSTRAAVRRTPRKPVPQYDPTDVQHSNGSADHSGNRREPNEWFDGGESAQSSVAYGHGPLHEENMGQMAKPMHYLIPDMPSPVRSIW